ncbi:MAG: nucleotide disphospho-sugar-binding domain-containing protein [Deltaproteobacteria bacterium]
MDKLRFVFETIGTRGDVAPLLAVAAEVQRRGFDATLLAPCAFARDARDQGVDFVPTFDRHLDRVGRACFDDFYFPALQLVVDYFDRARRGGQRLVVVNIDKTASSNLLCERDAVPGVRLHLTPFKLRSFIAPPWPFAAHARGPGRAAYLRDTLPRFLDDCDRHAGLLAHINARRGGLGLPPATSATPLEPHLLEQACLFPDWYGSPPADWPSGLRLLGFPLPEPAGSLSEPVRAFLAAGEPPLVFTTGTGVRDVREFFEHARGCCTLLQRRGLFLGPHLAGPGDPAILTVGFEELALVLPHSALLVHHGGIGTLARAVQAGIPQLVSPLKYDQPDNAHRVEDLGLGARLERAQLSAFSLAALARRLLSKDWPRRRLTESCQRVQACNGIDACAALLEQIARQSSPAPRRVAVLETERFGPAGAASAGSDTASK